MGARTGWVQGALIALLVLVAAGIGVVLWRATSAPTGAVSTRTGGGGGVASPQAPGGTALDALAKSQPLMVEGRWEEARAILGRAAEAYPNDQEVRVQLAGALQGLQQWGAAQEQLEDALAIGPATAGLHAMAGTVANRAGDLAGAAKHYAKAQELDPADARHPLYLGMIQIKQGQDGAAMASLARATRIDAHLGEAWGTMAELELRANRAEVAMQLIEKARQSQPEVARWRAVQSRIHRRQGEPAKGLALLQNLPGAQQTEALVLRELTEVLAMLGRPGEVASLHERAALDRPAQGGALLLEAARWHAKAGQIDRAKVAAAQAVSAGEKDAVAFLAELDGTK